MRLAPILVVAAVLASLFADDSMPLSPIEAIQQIGKPEVFVEMKVAAAKDRLAKRGICYLDSEDNFNSPHNLGVAISAEAAAKFKKGGINDLEKHFIGKSIRVRGCVMRLKSGGICRFMTGCKLW
jgi:hypothetical protein